jgi:starch-binding outer membrane protein, SusD/RagB family
MKKIILYFQLLLFVSFLTSCNKDFLDLQPLTAYSDVAVWKDLSLAETFVNGIYFKMEIPNGDNKYGTPNLCDELHRRDGTNQVNFNNSKSTSDLIYGWGSEIPGWNNLYVNIRACNKFLNNADKLPDDGILIDGVTKKTRLKGEVLFLRAWFYMRLTSLFGAVPIVDKEYQLTDDFQAARNTYDECVKFMVKDCDDAAAILPLKYSADKLARASKGAALALKSRILLYAASDLHNTTVFTGYAHPELIGYTDQSASARQARWQAAKDAAKAVMDLNLYTLFRANPAPTDSVATNFEALFNSKDCVEDIMVRYAVATTYNVNYSWMNLSGPNGYHGRGSNAPTDALVRDYERKDGTKFDWNNPVHAAAPYKFRDPRFYATIFYEGAKWRTRGPGEIAWDPIGVIQVGKWEKWDAANNKMVITYGLDTRNGPNSPFEGGYMGYYCRKYFDPAIDAQFFVPEVGWRYFRYAEILLNYAEACIGLGQDAEARTYINMIRKRAGMPDVTESGIALRDRYRNERRIEMAIEEQRFYDIRRWLIGPQAYVAAYRVDVVYKMDPVTHVTATVPTITPAVHNAYAWLDKSYFLPILRTELNKNPKLIQNPGYE